MRYNCCNATLGYNQGSQRPKRSVMDRPQVTTSALMDCEKCRREVLAVHADCDACYESAPDATPLERCEHYVCRRCGEEL